MSIPYGGPYPYIVTLVVTLPGEVQGQEMPVPVISYTVIEAVGIAALKAKGRLGVPTNADLRVKDIEPDYNYVQKPTPGPNILQGTMDTLVSALLRSVPKEPNRGLRDSKPYDEVKRDPGSVSEPPTYR